MKTAVTLFVAAGLLAVTSASMAKDQATVVLPKGNLGSWFPPSSYPPEAKRKGEQGRVSIRLTVSSLGEPVACSVTASSGSSSLDAATCDLALTNGHFIPAKDAAGKPIEATYLLSGVTWALYTAPLDTAPANEKSPAGALVWYAKNYVREPALGRWFRQSDYPKTAKLAGSTGRVIVKVSIATDGFPSSCWVVESSGVADLDAATCIAVLKRGRFEPPRDGNGNAMESSYLMPAIRWDLIN